MRKATSLLMLIFLLTSCASSRRLSRFFSEKSQSSEKQAERTNLFPLYYESGESSSVLWPLIDKDEHGFSFRPFFNKEDNEYALLFPLAAWNPVAGDGWMGPYFWTPERRALFPLFYKDDKNFQLLTYYNFDGTKGLFPLWHMNETGGWLGGVYGWNKTNDSLTHKALLGLLAYWEDENDGDHTHYIFPFYSTKDNGSTRSTILPLYYSGEDPNGAFYNMFLPFYLYDRNSQGETSFHSLLGGYSKVGDKTNMNVTPLWWSGHSSKGSYQTFFPIFHNSKYADDENLYLFPFYRGKDKSGQTSMLFPLFFGGTDKNSSFLLTPLSYSHESKRKSGLHIVPLFNSSKRFGKEGDAVESHWQFPWLIPLVSSTSKPNSFETSSLFGALYHHEGNDRQSRGSILGILAGWEKKENSSRFRFPALFNMTGLVDFSEDEKSSKVNLLIYSSEKTTTTTRRDIFPFITWDSGENDSGFSFLWRVFETHNRNGKKGGHILFIPWGESA